MATATTARRSPRFARSQVCRASAAVNKAAHSNAGVSPDWAMAGRLISKERSNTHITEIPGPPAAEAPISVCGDGNDGSPHRCALGCAASHSRASCCASAICAGVILAATRARLISPVRGQSLAQSVPPAIGPHVRLDVILRHALPLGVRDAEVKLPGGVALVGGVAIPRHRRCVALQHASALVVHDAEVTCAPASPSSAAWRYHERLCVVLRHAAAVAVHEAEIDRAAASPCSAKERHSRSAVA